MRRLPLLLGAAGVTLGVLAPVHDGADGRPVTRSMSFPSPEGATTSSTPGDIGYRLSMVNGQVIRWNPCRVITYQVNTAGATAGALADVQGAMARVASANGLSFRYLGPTAAIPQKSWQSSWPSNTGDIVVAWAYAGSGAGRSTLLPSSAVGEGGWTSTGTYTPSGSIVWQIRHGFVVLNRASNSALRPGFGAGQTRGELLLHEVGHTVGLQHTSATTQILYTTLKARSTTAYGSGDLMGLRRVGRAAGCIA